MAFIGPAAFAVGSQVAGERVETHVETITRTDFIEEFTDRMEPGQHSLFVGPTGRGKSTLMRDLLEAQGSFENIGILTPKGPDKAFDGMGKKVKTWPGGVRLAWHKWAKEYPPYIWQQVGSPQAGYAPLHGDFAPTLQWARGRPGWLWVIPDLQAISDRKFANLGGDVEWLTLTLRSAGSSLWMDAQRPAWIPRAAEDQVTNIVLFKNPDLATVERLREVISLPMQEIVPLMGDMEHHDFLWRDNIKDDTFFVLGEK